MFFGVGQTFSPRDSSVSSSFVRGGGGGVERFITGLVSSGFIFCLGRLLVLGRLDGGNDNDDDDDGGG